MKLGLYKQLVKNGEDNSPVFNGSATGNKLFDVKIEGMLKLSPNDKGIFYLVSINTTGCLVYIIKPLFSRMGDYKAWVVSVPRQVILSASPDIPAIVGEATTALEAGDDPQRLTKWFQRDYKEQDFVLSLPQYRSKYAYRLYGEGCKVALLEVLLGEMLVQKDYFDYEGVFFVDAGRRMMVRTEAMDDLSQKMLRQPAVLLPPRPETVPQDVSLIASKQQFDQPILSYVKARVKVTMKRPGFVDLEQQIAVAGKVCQVMLPSKMDWLYKVYPSFFNITDEHGQPLPGASVEIEGKVDVDQKEHCSIVPEANVRKSRITVKCDGYEPKTTIVDLTKYAADNPLQIKMKMVRNRVRYKVGGKITFDMERTKDEINESPLSGYEVASTEGNVVTLMSKKSGGRGSKKKGEGNDDGVFKVSKMAIVRIGVGLLSGLVIGGVAGWILGSSHGESVVRAEVEAQRIAKLERDRQIADSLENVRMTAYFDSIPSWKKSEMDSVFDGKLAGLYDALNTYDFVTVQSVGDEHNLDAGKQWHALDSVLSLMNEKSEYRDKLLEITKNAGEDGKKFYSPDGTITFATFIKKLEEARLAVDNQKK